MLPLWEIWASRIHRAAHVWEVAADSRQHFSRANMTDYESYNAIASLVLSGKYGLTLRRYLIAEWETSRSNACFLIELPRMSPYLQEIAMGQVAHRLFHVEQFCNFPPKADQTHDYHGGLQPDRGQNVPRGTFLPNTHNYRWDLPFAESAASDEAFKSCTVFPPETEFAPSSGVAHPRIAV